MEILFITHKYPPSMGGMQKQSYELITGMKKRCVVHTIIYNSTGSKLLFFLSLRRRIRTLFKKHPDISIVHLNDGLMALASIPALSLIPVPVTVTVHGLDFVLGAAYFRRWTVKQYNRLDHIITVSRSTADIMIKNGVDKQKVSVVNNGVDTDIHEIASNNTRRDTPAEQIGQNLTDKKLLVSVGRPVVRKGFSWFIRNVLPELPDNVLYLIAGPRQKHAWWYRLLSVVLPSEWLRFISLFLGVAMDEPEIHALIKNPAVRNKVAFLPSPPYPELLKTMGAADIFIMPNIGTRGDVEGFGLVALEAAMAGAPVLAAATEGITDAIQDGKNGRLVPAEDSTAWKNAITDLLEDDNARADLRVNAPRFTAEHYTWDRMVEGYEAVFREHESSLR